MRFACLAVALCVTLSAETLPETARQRNAESFEVAWRKIGENLWAPLPGGVNWQAVHDELKPKAAAAETMEGARTVMADMIGRLHMTHYAILPGSFYDQIAGAAGSAEPGFEIRVVGGEALVVSSERDDVRSGWILTEWRGRAIAQQIRTIEARVAASSAREMFVTHLLERQLRGDAGERVRCVFRGAANETVKLDIALVAPRGEVASLGYLPPQHVWLQARRLGDVGYIRFNMFLDPARIAAKFAEAVSACLQCSGMIIDLRGNPGGIGGMSMGFAGWFVERQGVRLGTMKSKSGELKFAIFPRPEVFGGPLAILTDALTASTAEIFAGGLQDIGRARVFGTRTAGAALPSMIEKLPNGDALQYAIADYVSEGGRRLEGQGVAPDEPVGYQRDVLLTGHDPMIDAAAAWIRKGDKTK